MAMGGSGLVHICLKESKILANMETFILKGSKRVSYKKEGS